MSERISTNQMEFRKDQRKLVCSSEYFAGGFPPEIDVTSVHTNRVVRFVVDTQAAYDNESWDGEQMEYIPLVRLDNIDRLVVFHEF